jgi:isopentenyl phosphate kinase
MEETSARGQAVETACLTQRLLTSSKPFMPMKAIKIGGSFITDKSGYKQINQQNIELVAGAISEICRNGEKIVIVHGAGSFGHSLVSEFGIGNGVRNQEQMIGQGKTHTSCMNLSSEFTEILLSKNVPAISLDPASLIIQKNKRIDSFNMDIINKYAKAGFVPVLRGDMVLDEDIGGSVCSGDQIMAWLGKESEMLVFVTDVDGVLDGNGIVIPEITGENFDQISKHLKPKENDVTGAMEGKIREMLGLGTTSCIVNGKHPERLVDLVLGRDAVCTKIR